MKAWIIFLICAAAAVVVLGIAAVLTNGFGLRKAQTPGGTPGGDGKVGSYIENDPDYMNMMSPSDGQINMTPYDNGLASRKRYPDPVPTDAPLAQQAIQAAAAIFWTVDLAQKHLATITSVTIPDTNQTTASLSWSLVPDTSLLRADVSSLLQNYANHPILLLRSYVFNALIQKGVAVELVDFMTLVSTDGVLTLDLNVVSNTIRILPTLTRFLLKGDVQSMIDALTDANGQSPGYIWNTIDSDADTVGVLSNNDVRFRVGAEIQWDSNLTIGDLRSMFYDRGLKNPFILDRLFIVRSSADTSQGKATIKNTVYIMLDTLNNRAVQLDNINNDDASRLTEKHTTEEDADKALVATRSWLLNAYNVRAKLTKDGFNSTRDGAPEGANWKVDVATATTPRACRNANDKSTGVATCKEPDVGLKVIKRKNERSSKRGNCPPGYVRNKGAAGGAYNSCLSVCPDDYPVRTGLECRREAKVGDTYSKSLAKEQLKITFSPADNAENAGSTLKHFVLKIDDRENLENALTHVENRLPYDINVWFEGPDNRGFTTVVNARQRIRITMNERNNKEKSISTNIDQRANV